MFTWADASSASLARSSIKYSLSVFMLFLTALFASVCSSCTAVLAALVRLLLFAPFFLPDCILWKWQQKPSLCVGSSSFPEFRCMCWSTSPWSVERAATVNNSLLRTTPTPVFQDNSAHIPATYNVLPCSIQIPFPNRSPPIVRLRTYNSIYPYETLQKKIHYRNILDAYALWKVYIYLKTKGDDRYSLKLGIR